MEYINDININEAVINVLNNNSIEPILNEFKLELEENSYKFLYKHIERCFKDEELKYAKFKDERNIVKEIVNDYLNGVDNNIISLSKELSRQLFSIMKGNVNITSCDLIVASIITDQGPMIAILKMDYINTFTHDIQFIDQKIGINLKEQSDMLPRSSKRIQKAAFIKPIREKDSFNLYVLDKQGKKTDEDEYGSNYFINNFLGCSIVINERDNTKQFIRGAETFIRRNFCEDASTAEKIRSAVRNTLTKNEKINIEEAADELFKDVPDAKDSFKMFMTANCEEEFIVDPIYVEKKLKKVHLKIDKDIDLYINDESYKSVDKFEIKRNGDGSINLVIKNVINYIEK